MKEKRRMPSKTIRITFFTIAVVSILAIGILTLTRSSVEAAQGSPDGIWSEVDQSRLVAPAGTRVIVPAKFRAVAITATTLRTLLARAPMVVTAARSNWTRILEVEAFGAGGQ